MQPEMQKSILQMARGAIMERADYEMSRLLANILDPNTSATAKRKLTLTLELKPDDDRQTITVSCIAKNHPGRHKSRCHFSVCGRRGQRGGDGAADPRTAGNGRERPGSAPGFENHQIGIRRNRHVEVVH